MGLFETLHGISVTKFDEYGNLEHCILNEENQIETGCGVVIPRWQDVRQKVESSLSFYPGGMLKSVMLETQTAVPTPLGELPAELLTFYPEGQLREIFSCIETVTNDWTEEKKAALCPSLFFSLPVGAFRAKLASLHFYQSGALRSMSFRPGETVVLRVLHGLMPTRIGFSLYEDGTIESVEPPYPIAVTTPIGIISAFDPSALGIHDDSNSLSFYPDGSIRSITSADNQIEVITPQKQSIFFAPTTRTDPLLHNQTVTDPVRITFADNSVTLENSVGKKSFSLSECCFRVFTLDGTTSRPTNCGDCASCNLCG